MAINNIPGVGPSNADVANAVAAVVPDSADITAAVPTTAQIATAVAAPSAATIAAAVAAPSAATIAAAVAAPSAATIASAVAAPSSATIASAVLSSGNSAGWGATGGDTWTVISSGNVNGASALNLTGLSGYKKYKLSMFQLDCGGSNVSFRGYINSGTTSNTYALVGREWQQSAAPIATNTAFGNNTMVFSNFSLTVAHYLELFIEGANLGGYKPISTKIGGYSNSGANRYTELNGGMTNTTAAINQIYVFLSSGTWNTGLYTLYGVN
jgi:hypothetical protein